MKTLLSAALLLSFSLSAFPSEKGGNTFRSYELEIALLEFEKSESCPSLIDMNSTLKAVCNEIGEEVLMSTADKVSKRFYRKCCIDKD